MTYVFIRSWHVWNDTFVSQGRRVKTLCGRRPGDGAVEAKELPLNDKSCETCLRLQTAQ